MEKTRTAFGERLYNARKKAGLSQKQVREKIGISQGTLSELENDANGSSYTAALAALYGESALYLAEGKREKSIVEIPPDSYPVNKNKLARVPVVGKSMGGLPDRMFTDEGRLSNGHDDYAEIYSSDQNAFVTRVDGNSMFPKYAQGEFALVEPNTPPEIEDDVLVKVNTGEVMLKRLVSRRGGIHLASYNEPQSYFFTEDQIVWMYYVAHPVPSKKIKSRT